MKTWKCDRCLVDISWHTYDVSFNRLNKGMCLNCQELTIEETYPPELAKVAIERLLQYGTTHTDEVINNHNEALP